MANHNRRASDDDENYSNMRRSSNGDQKIPRWFLLLVFTACTSILGVLIKNAWADLDRTKITIAQHTEQIQALKEGIQRLQQGNDTIINILVKRNNNFRNVQE